MSNKPKTSKELAAARLIHYIDHPVDFVKEVIGVTPQAWQEEALNAIATHKRVSIRAGHG